MIFLRINIPLQNIVLSITWFMKTSLPKPWTCWMLWTLQSIKAVIKKWCIAKAWSVAKLQKINDKEKWKILKIKCSKKGKRKLGITISQLLASNTKLLLHKMITYLNNFPHQHPLSVIFLFLSYFFLFSLTNIQTDTVHQTILSITSTPRQQSSGSRPQATQLPSFSPGKDSDAGSCLCPQYLRHHHYRRSPRSHHRTDSDHHRSSHRSMSP